MTYNLTNIGKKNAILVFPKDAGEHFLFRSPNFEKFPLSYLKPLINAVVNLRPKESYKVVLLLPQNVDPKKGVFLYDNLTKAYNPDPALVASPSVQICSHVK